MIFNNIPAYEMDELEQLIAEKVRYLDQDYYYNMLLANIGDDVNKKRYLRLAWSMPYDEILEYIQEYDASHPKMDELKFVRDIARKYKVTAYDVVTRIRDVRFLRKYRFSEVF